jgi:hypothetical protein
VAFVDADGSVTGTVGVSVEAVDEPVVVVVTAAAVAVESREARRESRLRQAGFIEASCLVRERAVT